MTKPQISMALLTFAAEDLPSWDHLFDRARAADRAGFDRVVVSDHVVYGENLEAYARPELGGQAGGKQPVGPDGLWLEPVTTLAVLAGITQRVRLGTNILLAALRRPVVLAKELSSLDVLSNGRLDIGVGVGWQREEYDAAGLDFERRGKLLNHTLSVMQTLWRNQRAEYNDDLLHFEKIHQMPKPRQPGGVPIWVSGTINDSVANRIARFGSAWIPWGPAAQDLPASIPQMRERVAAKGKDPSTLQIVGNLPAVRDSDGKIDIDRSLSGAAPLVEAGVTDVRVTLSVPNEPAAAEDFLSSVVGKFHAAVG